MKPTVKIELTLTELAYLRAAIERDMEDARDIIAFGQDEFAEAAYATAQDILRELPTEEAAYPF